MYLATLKSKFDSLLLSINGTSSIAFSTVVENGYEALVLARVMNEYKNNYGPVANLSFPTNTKFLNQNPGRFRLDRSFKLEFISGNIFYFAADVELFGLEALRANAPVGMLFEADVVAVSERNANDIINNYNGYPAPQHIDSAYECKFGGYNKGQLREFLGLKRHLCYLGGISSSSITLFSSPVLNSSPPIALKMSRPKIHNFFNIATATLYDLEQIIII